MSDLNVTMVAFHGPNKPPSLQGLLSDVREALTTALRPELSPTFEAYQQSQVHATLIGMEAIVLHRLLYGHWFSRNRSGARRLIEVARLHEIVRRVARRTPMFTIRFGGFAKAQCTCVGGSSRGWRCPTSAAEFHSCDRSAYEGSFYAYSPGPVMLTGWPVQAPDASDAFPHLLYDFRLAAESAGFLDKYHSDDSPHWMDDDCYLKLGAFRERIASDELRGVEEALREFLRARPPVTVDIAVEDISVVLYSDPSLKGETIVERVPLREFIEDPKKVEMLYARLLAC